MSARTVYKYLFARRSRIADASGTRRDIYAAVEAYDKDHAILRLKEYYPFIDSKDWNFIDELEPEHFLGVMGTDIPLWENIPEERRKLLH